MPEGRRADLSLREKERKVQSLQMQGITGRKMTVLELVEQTTCEILIHKDFRH